MYFLPILITVKYITNYEYFFKVHRKVLFFLFLILLNIHKVVLGSRKRQLIENLELSCKRNQPLGDLKHVLLVKKKSGSES